MPRRSARRSPAQARSTRRRGRRAPRGGAWGGAEFLAGIPGTVGGALAMNAGCFGAECWDIVERAVTIDRSGDVRERPKQDFEIGYRHCALKGGGEEWFAAAYFRLQRGDGAASRPGGAQGLARGMATQPPQLP